MMNPTDANNCKFSSFGRNTIFQIRNLFLIVWQKSAISSSEWPFLVRFLTRVCVVASIEAAGLATVRGSTRFECVQSSMNNVLKQWCFWINFFRGCKGVSLLSRGLSPRSPEGYYPLPPFPLRSDLLLLWDNHIILVTIVSNPLFLFSIVYNN